MTAKEKRHVRKLEIRIEELERHFKIANNSHAEVFLNLYDTRRAMREAYESLIDAARTLEDLMRNDPAFMQQKAEMEANF